MLAPRPILTGLRRVNISILCPENPYMTPRLSSLQPKITGRCHKITRHEKKKSQNLPHRNFTLLTPCKIKVTVKWSRCRPGVAQRVGRDIALLFHDRGTRRWWVVSSTPRPHFIPGKDPVPILQEVGWAPGAVWTGGKSRLHRDSIPDRPASSQSLYRLSYPAHYSHRVFSYIHIWTNKRTR